ncbi:Ankyrin repeat domain-containing protein 50 [Trichoderma lentiforme]|uniref:Ankyrin repeat domain-containing protein 50 n=1 Tax=Trichoderma lentiforme TaxID=1567552 RepID=A0A9P4XM83_9HYPO|nr:Ankyrin repeat domain-containing protein 50 [Trichoderma lentiforme]
MSKKLSHDDYTVGWICPLEVEQVAALEMLDEEHVRLPQPPTDHNVYSLGSISGINIVVAGLYQAGNSQAATVATQLRMTFPNIRFGLLVGIGGGIPVKTDNGMIRLGDIVVSKPSGIHSGAIQYDHGKARDGVFERIGSLAPPPAVLLNAAQDLGARRARSRKDPLEDNIKRIDTSIRGLRKYKYPGADRDYLYLPNHIHSQSGLLCEECGCSESQRIKRDREDEGYLVVHRGTIASGELVIKNALLRDLLAQEHGLLCFETEAAGALADFPCLVIRGISDYCDSHKNNEWHGYAAAAAAAYARQLFFHMPIDETQHNHDIHHGGIRQDHLEEPNVLNWLTTLDVGQTQSDYLALRQPGTGQWLLNSSDFQEWLYGNLQTLFCVGLPGSGKTVLASMVIDELTRRFGNDREVGIAYEFCNFRRQDEQKDGGILFSMLRVMVKSCSTIPENIIAMHKQHKRQGTRPTFEEIMVILQAVIAKHSRVFIVIDALDEYPVTGIHRTRFLSEIFRLQRSAGGSVKILATSRPIPEIVEEFETSTQLKVRASDEDIRRYVDGHLPSLPSFIRKSVELQEEVQTAIIKAVDGMFLLAQFHVESLIGKRSIKAIRAALKKLPTGTCAYDQVYDDAMERIYGSNKEKRELAKESLIWISCALQPLKTIELQHALAVEIGEYQLDEENLPDIMDIVSVCAGLVTVDEENDVIRLVHYTAQEYFNENWDKWFKDADAYICGVCVNYLAFDVFGRESCITHTDLKMRLEQNPLYDYAATYWGSHARRQQGANTEQILEFLRRPKQVEASTQILLIRDQYFASQVAQHDHESLPSSGLNKFHIVSYFGLYEAARDILLFSESTHGDKAGIDAKDIIGQTPLILAVFKRHIHIVQMLIASDSVDINSRDFNGTTPLFHAVYNSDEEIVKLLVESGKADVFKEACDITAFWLAIHIGSPRVVKLLVDAAGAALDVKDIGDGTALKVAAELGIKSSVEALLDSKMVNMDGRDAKGRTCLSWAAAEGHEEVVRLLLDRGAISDINGRDLKGWTAFSRAAAAGHDSVVRLLLERGANSEIDAKDADGLTSLSKAAFWGQDAVMRLLLAWGANIESEDNTKRTPLLWAAARGQTSAVQILLEAGSDSTATESSGLTPLHLASFHGHFDVVKLLLQQPRVMCNTRDADGRSPLFHASWRGHKLVFSLLANHPMADLRCEDNYGITLLSAALRNSHEEIVDLILLGLGGCTDILNKPDRSLSWRPNNEEDLQRSSHLLRYRQSSDEHPNTNETLNRSLVSFDEDSIFCKQ